MSLNRETPHLVGSRSGIMSANKSPLMIPVPNHIISPHIIINHFVQVNFNAVLQPTPRSLKWPLPFRFRTKILYVFLIAHMRATCPDILFFFIWSLQLYLVNCTNYEFPPVMFFVLFSCNLCIFIERVYVFLLLSMYSYCSSMYLNVVYIFLLLPMYSYCCLCILIVRPCILIAVYVYLLLSMYY